ncbi:MAG TPA: PP2C family protein-serine/threonine phosphatase [Holophagaceae bacterium]|nr:PP2C family protein-serine/threonine phosphatase [Holophagaceae bacterium]
MNAPEASPAPSPFDRLRGLSLRIPEGASELLPLIDFLEAFPQQGTEEDLVHLVGVTALGIARASQGGIWDGQKWIFLRGQAPAFPMNPGKGWSSFGWVWQEEALGTVALKSETVPQALPLLLSVAAPLLMWRRMEHLRSDQNRALALQLSRLNTVFDLTHSLGQVETKQELITLMAATIMGEFRIPRLLVLDRDGSVLVARGVGQIPPALEGEALRSLVEEKRLVHALELRDATHSFGFAYAADPTIGKLSEEDDTFLQTLMNLAAGQLSSLEMRHERIQKERLEKDMDLARNIQRQILPKRLPEPPGWECAAANLPYQAVGGDLYDLWLASDPPAGGWEEEQEGERLHFAVADISGKGLPASLMMTQLSAYLRARADRRVKNWGRLATRLNTRMNEVRDRQRYATLIAGSINPETGDLRFVNGGHNPPLVVKADGAFRRLDPTGPMVGLLPGASWEQGRAQMDSGDTLIVFTDGLVEAENGAGEELGDEALARVVRDHPGASADDLLEHLLVAAFKHLETGSFRDDVTLVVVKRSA